LEKACEEDALIPVIAAGAAEEVAGEEEEVANWEVSINERANFGSSW
jgi:hypothetical protein